MITCKNNFGELVEIPEERFEFRPSVYGIIRNGQTICVCHSKYNGKLWFPGGGIEKGEKMLDALLREIKEETGLEQVRIGRLLGSFENFFYFELRNQLLPLKQAVIVKTAMLEIDWNFG